jgi:hypothetical protein
VLPRPFLDSFVDSIMQRMSTSGQSSMTRWAAPGATAARSVGAAGTPTDAELLGAGVQDDPPLEDQHTGDTDGDEEQHRLHNVPQQAVSMPEVHHFWMVQRPPHWNPC